MKNAKKRAPSISIRWQLMFFIGAMTLLTVGLIWGIITYALAPKYNATIRQNLIDKASAITAIFDQTDSEISSRDFGVFVPSGSRGRSENPEIPAKVIDESSFS